MNMNDRDIIEQEKSRTQSWLEDNALENFQLDNSMLEDMDCYL